MNSTKERPSQSGRREIRLRAVHILAEEGITAEQLKSYGLKKWLRKQIPKLRVSKTTKAL
jgi:hypothetical protein